MSVLREIIVVLTKVKVITSTHKEAYMAKAVVDGVVPVSKDEPVCQNCKAQRNNPSFCKTKNDFTGRKNTCEEFKK